MTLTTRILFGGALSQFGWGIIAFGMVFVWVFDAGGAISSAIRFSGRLASAEGVSTGWRQTNLSINDTPVYETSYSFRDADGEEHGGASYRTGGYVEAGQAIAVEYLPSDPTVSRVVGMRASSAGLGIAFIWIFPLTGLGLALTGMRRGLRARRLMATGELALGRMKSKEATSTVVNNKTVYRYAFEFEATTGGRYEAIGKTHRTSELEDEALERIVYDPYDPVNARVLDELPCRPYVDDRGDFVPESSDEVLWAALNLVLPAAAVSCWIGYTVGV